MKFFKNMFIKKISIYIYSKRDLYYISFKCPSGLSKGWINNESVFVHCNGLASNRRHTMNQGRQGLLTHICITSQVAGNKQSYSNWTNICNHCIRLEYHFVWSKKHSLCLMTIHFNLKRLDISSVMTDSKTMIFHYNDVIMGEIASRITSLTIVFSTVYSDADQRKHQSSAPLAFVRGIHRGPVNPRWIPRTYGQ